MKTSILTIETCKMTYTPPIAEDIVLFNTLLLKYLLFIYYLILFKKNQAKIYTFLDFGRKINIIILASVSKLGFKVQPINFGAQKIYSSIFKTFKIVLFSFQIEDKLERARFF